MNLLLAVLGGGLIGAAIGVLLERYWYFGEDDSSEVMQVEADYSELAKVLAEADRHGSSRVDLVFAFDEQLVTLVLTSTKNRLNNLLEEGNDLN